MKKIIIISIFILGLTVDIFPQDSIFNKPIVTSKFDLTTNSDFKNILNSDFNVKNFGTEDIFKDCLLINQVTDSSFYVHYDTKKELILYKNVSKIFFKEKNRIGWGIFLGTLGGLISGVSLTYLVSSNIKKENLRLRYYFYSALLFIPTFTIGGMAVGWAIGNNSYSGDTYDISKYNPDKKKDKILKIFISKQINF